MGQARWRLVWKKTIWTFRNTQLLVFYAPLSVAPLNPPPIRSLICILQLHYYYTSLLFIPLVSVISPPAHTYKSPAFSLPHNKLMPHTWLQAPWVPSAVLHCQTRHRQPFLWHISLGCPPFKVCSSLKQNYCARRWRQFNRWQRSRAESGTDWQPIITTSLIFLSPFFGLRTLEGHLVIASFLELKHFHPNLGCPFCCQIIWAF